MREQDNRVKRRYTRVRKISAEGLNDLYVNQRMSGDKIAAKLNCDSKHEGKVPELLSLYDSGRDPVEIAKQLDIPRKAVDSVCRNLRPLGRGVPLKAA
jgi:hypothetical protein